MSTFENQDQIFGKKLTTLDEQLLEKNGKNFKTSAGDLSQVQIVQQKAI